jgi:ATP adenylyltransferase
MEHLWAPWRNSYLQRDEQQNKNLENLFQHIGMSSDDEKHFVIHRSRACYALLNRYPYNTGHTLVVPYRPVSDLAELSDDEMGDLWKTVQKITDVLKTSFKPDGFNIGINIGRASGAGIPQHLHIHVVPRWEGDANFMTSTANTRIHPNELKTIFDKMIPSFAAP